MKTFKRVFTIVIMAVMMILSLASCSETPEQHDLVIILGNRANTPYSSNFIVEEIEDVLLNSALSHSQIMVVIPDGSPEDNVYSFSNKESSININDEKKMQLANIFIKEFIEEISQLTAKSEETDMLKSIHFASDYLESSTADKKSLIILDSGIATNGIFNFIDIEFDSTNIESIIEKIEQAQELPSLNGVDVMYYGIGQTIEPQKQLSEKHKTNLESLYNALFKKANANSIEFSSKPIPNEERDQLPYVTPIEFSSEKIVVTLEEPIKLSNSKLSFIGDTAEFVSPQSAIETLIPISEMLIHNESLEVYIVGTTTKVGDNSINIPLSEDRADAVIKELVKLGVNQSQLTAIGLGESDSPIRDNTNDLNNMAVTIIDKNSELGREIG